MATRTTTLLLLPAILFLSSQASSQLGTPCWKDKSKTAPQRLKCYVDAHLCSGSRTDKCLKETHYTATRSDGRVVQVHGVYSWFNSDLVQDFEHPHFLLTYLRRLREAYRHDPDTHLNQLFNEIDFLITDAVDRNGALVWENKYGIAQGMEQAEYADYFASVAATYRDKGEMKLARGTMNYALKFARALDMPVGHHTGGVTSGQFYCGSKRARFRPCYWYHSRGRGIDLPGVQTVLNQHFHVVRDALSLYLNVKNAPELVDPQFGTPQEVLDRLEDRAIAGLYQLAFSAGNTSVQRSRPPNVRQFMNYFEDMKVKPSSEHPDGNPLDYYWAFYQYDMNEGEGKDIASTCFYHTHALDVMAGIIDVLYNNPSLKETQNGWRLYEAIDALLQGEGESTGKRGSTNALYQFYRSEGPAFKVRRQGCTNDDLNEKSADIYSSVFD